MAPYERLLGDAMRGDRTLFGSEAGIEAAWWIVDPILSLDERPDDYDANGWGPQDAEWIATTAGGWISPTVPPGIPNPRA